MVEENKIKIGIDLDDTIVSFYDEFIDFCRNKYNINLNILELDKDFLNSLGNEEKTLAALKEFVDEGRSHEKIFEDFREVFKELKKIFDIHFITARYYDLRKKTREFLETELGTENFQIHYIIDSPEKKKSVFCKNNNINFLVEDHVSNIIECADEGIKVFVFDQPWNKDVKESENILRIKNWGDILDKLKWI